MFDLATELALNLTELGLNSVLPSLFASQDFNALIASLTAFLPTSSVLENNAENLILKNIAASINYQNNSLWNRY